MTSIDAFLDRSYDLKKYNCLHHASEVWLHLTGLDITVRLAGVLNGITKAHVAGFELLKKPVDPCLALLLPFKRASRRDDFHVGVYLDRRIIHIMPTGVQYQPVDVVMHGFRGIQWYR